MKATIEIDDDLYSRLEIEAESRGRSVRDLLIESLQMLLISERSSTSPKRRIKLPLIDSGQPGKLNIPDDIVSQVEMREDLERHEASLR